MKSTFTWIPLRSSGDSSFQNHLGSWQEVQLQGVFQETPIFLLSFGDLSFHPFTSEWNVLNFFIKN